MGSENRDRPGAKQAFVAPKSQYSILLHAVMAGLTPLIPVPFVDDWARDGIQTRMVKHIAKTHDKRLYDSDAEALGRASGGTRSLIRYAAKKLAFYPIKRIFRTAVFVLALKDMSDIASRTYHVGYLLDYAIGAKLTERCKPEALRAAIDEVCANADTSVVNHAFRTAFNESRDLLADAVQTLRSWVGGDKAHEPREVEDLAKRLQRTFDVLPADHFIDLRKALDRSLGIASE